MPKVKKTDPPFAPLGRLLRGYGVSAVALSVRTGWSYGKASARVNNPGSITLGELEIIRRKFEIPKAQIMEALGGTQ